MYLCVLKVTRAPLICKPLSSQNTVLLGSRGEGGLSLTTGWTGGIVHTSSFISPGKRGTNALFDVLQFLTPFTHVSRYPGALNGKQKNGVEKTALIIWSQVCEKMA